MILALALLLQDEWQVSFYAGKAWTLDSDLEYEDLELEDVSWEDESFESPIYYGVRAAYWRDDWGFVLDFHHAKVYLEDARFDAVGELGISHGYNVLTLNLAHRCRWGPLRPYGGLGLGVVIAHVEANIGAERVSEYQVEAPAAHAMLGVELDVLGPLGIFTEAKLAYGDLDLQVPGGTIETNLFTPQLVAGLTLRF